MLDAAQIVRLIDIANAGCHKGMVLEARAIYNSILEIKPDHVPASIGLALSHIVLSDFAKAEEMLRDILLKNHEESEARALLGFCFFLQKKQEEARQELLQITETEQGFAFASTLLKQMS